jgi:hypothetical protein
MQQMTPLEAITVAHWYVLVARSLNSMAQLSALATNPGLVIDLNNAAQDLTTQSSNILTAAAQQVFADANSAFEDLSDAASQAATIAKQYQTDAANANSLLNIAASLVTLAAAIGTGNYGSALQSLIALVGQPTKGQGAQDPLSS